MWTALNWRNIGSKDGGGGEGGFCDCEILEKTLHHEVSQSVIQLVSTSVK
jgi:hypothetical protein